MKTIEEIIYDEYWAHKRARLPDTDSMKLPPPDEPWETTEVFGLIRNIISKCNSELAKRYLED